MNKIIAKRNISGDVVKLEIRTSLASTEIIPGRYIVLVIEKDKPGIPVAVLKSDSERETVTVIFNVTDKYSAQLAELKMGEELFAIDGPFGYPAQIQNYGVVLCIAREAGIVMLLPLLNSLRLAGNRIITILSAQTKDGILLENEVRGFSDELKICTDDGSSGEKKNVCQMITQSLNMNKISQLFVVASAPTIKVACSHATKYNIPIQAFLYAKKANSSASHGVFKVTICGSARAVCVDGYNFNAWFPNLEEMIKRFGRDEGIPCKTISAKEEYILI